MLAQSILSLDITPAFVGATITIASISRMKAKVLSIVSLFETLHCISLFTFLLFLPKFMFLQLQHVFEAESVSFLDKVAEAGNLHLAEAIVSEVSPNKMLCSKINRMFSFLI